ncbi:phosphatase PAP2 family protein [Salinibacterium sp. SYSU T00001]|uniref:phosphatase PAP2 family protein n=1 Tax=Homoserinimonas sedimenticola TaxID=2986805 RepID=UPI002235D9E4|nr:phosphatase PAP2 family protein [Salinibacterium sedimenticola]MCW4385195.1 phosphatase PAP2 family protein [Salinibacterium sedimenticola]
MPTSREARKVTHRWPLISGISAVVLAAVLGGLIALRAGNAALESDTEWLENIREDRGIWFDTPALLLDWLGGGVMAVWVVPLVTIGVLCLVRRFWAALYYLVAIVLSVLLVQVLKTVFGRPRPEDILVISDEGSFPSGHVANAATIAVTLGIIVSRAWVWFAGVIYVLLMLLSRTYLAAHWITDTIGGALIGAGVAVIVWAPFAARLERERHRRQDVSPRRGDTG